MSFILSSLQKANEQQLSSSSLASEALQEALVQPDQQLIDDKFTYLKKLSGLVIYCLLVSALAAVSYYLFGGYQADQLRQQRLSLQSQLTSPTAEQQPLRPLTELDRQHALVANGSQINVNMTQQRLNARQARQQELRALQQRQQAKQAAELASRQQLEQKINRLLLMQQHSATEEVSFDQEQLVAQADTDAQALSVEEVQVTPSLSLNREALDDIDPALLAAVEAALTEPELLTNDNQTSQTPDIDNTSNQQDPLIKPLGQMPSWLQEQVSPLSFSLHMYSSDANNRWLRLNGKDYYEGEVSDRGVVIETIAPQQVILSYQGYRFKVPALSAN
ncbi:general secretion pathway protein GspB [Thalassotalea ponticola]|uniref:general secretion pathway protein GspB n=1 Tax=Thalassotalea ponticola TaxID=1523392 RepID=UPI0025B57401|nr:general secretion pathway protein GspB [Thalassotalea ponticola]MDN3651961.1 general secretion pathway protein GspB [Thalassotalea ponticola]